MSNEIADALRAFADQIEKGAQVPNPVEACIVLSNAEGLSQATYVGRKLPARDAGMFLLTNGLQRLILGSQNDAPAAAPPPFFGATRGSTH